MHVSKYSMWCFFCVYAVYGVETKQGLTYPSSTFANCGRSQAWVGWWHLFRPFSSSHPINPVNAKKPSHRIFRHMHGVLNEDYLQNFLHRWTVNRETNLMSLLNPCFCNSDATVTIHWLLINHGLISIIRFVSQFTTHLCKKFC